MVGGEAADLERARPALEPLAKAIFHLGPLGTGSAMKLAVNALIFGLNQALAEGLVLAELAGIDRARRLRRPRRERRRRAVRGLQAGGVRRPGRRRRSRSPSTSPRKDLRLITELADALGLPSAAGPGQPRAGRRGVGGRPRRRDFSTVASDLRARARPAVARDGARQQEG